MNRLGTLKKSTLLIAAILGLVAISSLVLIYRHATRFVDTDDAQLTAHIYPIVARVPGYVLEVPITDNQAVKKGDRLVAIDPKDLEAQVEAAQAALAQAKEAYAASLAKAESAKALANKAAADLKRYSVMRGHQELSAQEYDAASTTAKTALADHQAREHDVSATLAVIAEREAGLKFASSQRGYTDLLSPVDGLVTHKQVKAGQYVEPGQTLLAIVDTHDVWVVANFKETQLEDIRPGQKVKLRLDTYPGVEFSGHVDSIQWGTGAQFSLFPPENATGNFVKIVQRIPVKIVFDTPPSSQYVLAPGMSVIPEIEVR